MKIDFAAKRKLKTVTVEVPDYEAMFRLQALTIQQSAQIVNKLPEGEFPRIHELAYAIVDDDGKPIYTPDEIKEMDPAVFGILREALDKLNKTGPGAADEIAKN